MLPVDTRRSSSSELVTSWAGPSIEPGVLEAIVGVYDAVFAEAPWYHGPEDTARFRDDLPWYMECPRSRWVVATQGQGALAAFAFGFQGGFLPPLRDALILAYGATAAVSWLEDAFQFVELAVLPAYRGRGIGGRLHDALLAPVRSRTAILLTDAGATAALGLYRSRGWELLLDGYVSRISGRPTLVMGLRAPASAIRKAAGRDRL